MMMITKHRTKTWIVLLLTISITLILSQEVKATTVQIQSNTTGNLADTYVSSASDSSKGAGDYIRLNGNNTQPYYEHGMFKFNISLLTSDAIIDSADLCLYIYDNYLDSGESYNVSAHHIYSYPDYNVSNDEWIDDEFFGVKWSTRPTTATQYNLTVENLTIIDNNTDDTWVCWNITTMTGIEHGESDQNVSVFLMVNGSIGSSPADYLYFRSREYTTDTSLRPYLNVTYHYNYGTLSVLTEDGDQNHSYSATKSSSDSFNLTISNDGTSANTISFNLYDDLNDSTKCNISFGTDPLSVGASSSENESVTITINDSVAQGTYGGIIEVERTDDSSTVNITVNFTVSYGIPNITVTSFTINVNESATTTHDFIISNEGNYDITSCTLTFNTSIEISTHSWNISSFTVTNTSDVDAQLSITATTFTGTDNSATVNINCSSYSGSQYEEETVTGTFTVVDTWGEAGGGGGGGSYVEITYNNTNIIGSTVWMEGDGICDSLLGEPSASEDCQLTFTANSIQMLMILLVGAGIAYILITNLIKQKPKKKRWLSDLV